MRGKDVLEEMMPYQPGKSASDIQEEFGLDKIVKLASNENPYGYSPKLKAAISKMDTNFELYPDGYSTDLREALSERFSLSKEQFVFGSGSDEIIQMISRVFLYPGVHTVMATPTFPQYKHHAKIEGADITEVPLVDGAHDLEKMLDAITDQTNVIWLCTPNNPTGIAIDRPSFDHFMENCPKDVLVVLDEAYYEYQDEKYDLKVVERLDQYENLITLRTFSKAYGLAGLRVGYGMTSEKIARQLNIVRGPFNTSKIAQQAAKIALQDDQFVKETVRKTKNVKKKFAAFLDQINWSYDASETNFMLVSTPVSGEEMFDYLMKHGFIVRPGELLGCPSTIRVTIGTEEDMEELQNILETFNRNL